MNNKIVLWSSRGDKTMQENERGKWSTKPELTYDYDKGIICFKSDGNILVWSIDCVVLGIRGDELMIVGNNQIIWNIIRWRFTGIK